MREIVAIDNLEAWDRVLQPLTPRGQDRLRPGLCIMLFDIGEEQLACECAAEMQLSERMQRKWRTLAATAIYDRYRPLFESRGMYRQAIQALMFLRGAVEAEAATVFAVGYVLDFIKRLREDDTLVFRPPVN